MRRFPTRAVVAFALVIAVGLDTAAAATPRSITVEPPAPCLLAPVTAPVADPFRSPACRWCPGNRGLEYDIGPGAAIRAAAGGLVSFAGPVAGTIYVVVQHPSGLRTTYGRLASASVQEGDTVGAGTEVGRSATGLFFGVRLGDTYLDPASYLLRVYFPPRLVPLGGPRRPGRSAGLTCVARRTSR